MKNEIEWNKFGPESRIVFKIPVGRRKRWWEFWKSSTGFTVMSNDFEKELVRHNYDITLIHKALDSGIITMDEFLSKQEEGIKTTSQRLYHIVHNG